MPDIELPRKLERILYTTSRIIVLIGGRSSAKSETAGRFILMKCQTEAADVLCGREFQASIDDSVHKLLRGLINTVPVDGFYVTDKKIDCQSGGDLRFKGFARNSDAVKSAQDFKYCWIEEAQSLSQESIDNLLPTIRAKGSQLLFTANPQSSADPFSKRFINPFINTVKSQGYYEDDMHLVIMANWRDNPWHGELEAQRVWDFNNLPRAKYDWIWEGEFNDSVEDPLILAEWFDACIDAHLKLGFEPIGLKYASHDPSDVGPDAKAFAYRHGSVLLDLQEKLTGDINEGGDWATGLTVNHGVDAYIWDCDGMGVGLKAQTVRAFTGKKIQTSMFKGSEKAKNPDAILDSIEYVENQRKNKEAFKNQRAQAYFMLRERVHRTYKAVVEGEYHDPDTLISFSSDIKILGNLRSELCRMPLKPNPNGFFQLYTKPEMKKQFKFASPNLADAVMMLMVKPYAPPVNIRYPRPVRPMGKRAGNKRGRAGVGL